MELESDMSIKSEAEVVIEHVQRKLKKRIKWILKIIRLIDSFLMSTPSLGKKNEFL